ncbi:transporter [Prauserella marina]|uniref:Putative tricarboxylic transport membrane protein n=1 Tax=Prauserella marina TaxID=530584 RepID=A0A222VLX8_9PSEU|nr:tripartite tricarboxylate transporter permease [Prauserella marina]ASR34763.1 transporter [Prauserella marina]PWV85563.1 putative tricarboxylic transport membrane protein [Prauserella marina]SDC51794.1 putative tricarboxylic transport membrane protein [Prauserella marina]
MDFFSPVLAGFGVVFQSENLLYCLLGVTLGMLVGVLPGLGPAATIAILLPVTYNIEPTSAIIMLAGIFYGAQYGGTITSVLLRLPGEASSVVTAIDGHEMAKQGRAGAALGIAAIGSFIGGTISIVVLTFVAPLVAGFALDFGPAEYTMLALLGILLVTTLGTGSVAKSLLMAALGLLLATIGQDPLLGTARFTFGSDGLLDGIDFVIVAMGLFGVGEILYNLESLRHKAPPPAPVGSVYPSRKDLRESRGAISRGSVVGFLLGILPGGGATMSSMVAYAVERRTTKKPERFGKGAIEGVAGPETANNAAATSSFIPLLSLGIPANATMAIMFGALLLQGITPGPLLVDEEPELFWGVVNSMYIGNLLLLAMSLPLIGLFVRILRVRPAILAPLTILITMIGVYTVRMNVFDMFLVIGLGVLGYLMKKTGFEPGPLVLAFVLGGILESAFRRSMRTFDGELSGFLTQPIAASLLGLIVLLIAFSGWRALRNREPDRRKEKHGAAAERPAEDSSDDRADHTG